MSIHKSIPLPVAIQFSKREFHQVIFQPNGCWEWQGGKTRNGYAKYFHAESHRDYRCNRLAYFLYYLTDPAEKYVCHACDNPLCVNPLHLWLGTAQDNNADRANKDRSFRPKGERHPHARLTEQDIIQIRTDYASGRFRQCEMAIQYQISPSHIHNIVRNKRW